MSACNIDCGNLLYLQSQTLFFIHNLFGAAYVGKCGRFFFIIFALFLIFIRGVKDLWRCSPK